MKFKWDRPFNIACSNVASAILLCSVMNILIQGQGLLKNYPKTHIQTNIHTNTQNTYILTQDLMLSNEYLYRGAGNTEKLTSKSHTHIPLWHQKVLNINSWPHCMKGGKEVQAFGIKEGGERVADVTRIIT